MSSSYKKTRKTKVSVPPEVKGENHAALFEEEKAFKSFV